MVTSQPRAARNETLYNVCLYGSIGMFVLNLVLLYALLFYIDDHDYSIVTENMAIILTIAIAFGCFYALSNLYTITMKEHAYDALRGVGMSLTGLYLTVMVLFSCWILLESMTSTYYYSLFQLIFWPGVIECVITFAVGYAFYNMYSPAKSQYVLVPYAYRP